jgi:hypothetical protein
MAATEKKTGSSWFGGWFKPKALSETIKNVDLTLEVDDKAAPSITLRGDESAIKALVKSLKQEGVIFPRAISSAVSYSMKRKILSR